jgi:hypothetical protein
MGGAAVGYYAFGGTVLADHGLSGAVRDPAAVQFFEPWADSFITGFAIFTTIGVAATVLTLNLTIAIAKRHSGEAGTRLDKHLGHRRGGGAGCVVAALFLALMFGGFLTASSVVWLYLSAARQREQVLEARQVADSHIAEAVRNQAEVERETRERIEERESASTREQSPPIYLSTLLGHRAAAPHS